MKGYARSPWSADIDAAATLQDLPSPPGLQATSSPAANGDDARTGAVGPPGPDPTTPGASAAAALWTLLLLAFLIVLACTATAWLVSSRSPKVYAADAELLVPVREDGEPQDVERELATQRVVIDGPGVLHPAAERLGTSADDLADAISTSVVEGSQVIRVRARGTNPDEALRRLEVVLREYTSTDVSSDQSEAERYVDEQLAAVKNDQARLQLELDAVRQLPAPGDPARDRRLSEQLQAGVQRTTILQDQLLQMQLQQLQTTKATVISAPSSEADPIEPTPARSAALGLLAGLLLATALVATGRWLLGGRAS